MTQHLLEALMEGKAYIGSQFQSILVHHDGEAWLWEPLSRLANQAAAKVSQNQKWI